MVTQISLLQDKYDHCSDMPVTTDSDMDLERGVCVVIRTTAASGMCTPKILHCDLLLQRMSVSVMRLVTDDT